MSRESRRVAAAELMSAARLLAYQPGDDLPPILLAAVEDVFADGLSEGVAELLRLVELALLVGAEASERDAAALWRAVVARGEGRV